MEWKCANVPYVFPDETREFAYDPAPNHDGKIRDSRAINSCLRRITFSPHGLSVTRLGLVKNCKCDNHINHR